MERAHRRRTMSRPFVQISVLSLALIAFGAAEIVGGNGFIASFVAGMVAGTRSRTLLDAVEDLGETEGHPLGFVVFLLFGAVLLPPILADLTVMHIVYAVLSLTAIRMVAVALSLVGVGLRWVTVGFLGWFGPRGLASILYVLLISGGEGLGTTMALADAGEVTAIVYITVFLSILLHGASAAPAARAYARIMKRWGPDEADEEHRPVRGFPTRVRHTPSPSGR